MENQTDQENSQEVIDFRDTEWPWPQYPQGGKRNFLRLSQEPFMGWEGDFLEGLRNTGTVRAACFHAKVSYRVVNRRKKSDEEFRAAWGEALEMANDALVSAAFQRAVYGVTREKQHYLGEKLLWTEKITEYSDQLLQFLIRGRMKAEFGDHVDHNFNITVIRQEVERMAQAKGFDEVQTEALYEEVLRMKNLTKG